MSGRKVDLGLLAEALIYYDRISLVIDNHEQLAALVDRFAAEGLTDKLIAMFESGEITLLHLAFFSAPLLDPRTNTWTVLNLQAEEQASDPRSFELTVLGKLRTSLHAHKQRRVLEAVRKHAVELKASQYGARVKNVTADLANPERCALVVQALVDDTYDLLGYPKPPKITAEVTKTGGADNGAVSFSWKGIPDLKTFGPPLGDPQFGKHSPLSGALAANMAVWAAGHQNCDLFLGSPLSRLAGDTLYEGADAAGKAQSVIQELQEEVEFPDVHQLFTVGKLGFTDALLLRSKADRFRVWLRDEAGRDRNSVVAYHQEVAEEAGFVRAGRKLLKLTSYAAPLVASQAGVLAGIAHRLVFDLAARYGEGWRPVMFGTWSREQIARVLGDQARTSGNVLNLRSREPYPKRRGPR